MYKMVAGVAKATDGHRLLRVTEIFANVEADLKYSASPRILFETAVMKASMPQADYDIESLIARISELEKRLENGVVVANAGGMYESNAIANATANATPTLETPIKQAVKQPVKAQPIAKVEEPVYEDEVPPALDAPPDESETGGNVYFDTGFAPKEEPKIEPTPHVQSTNEKPVPRVIKPAARGDAKATFGAFLRSIRKIARSGVLLTLCMDLDSEYEGETFVLYTTSDTIYRSLNKEDHAALIKQAFEGMGIEVGGYDIRIRGKQADVFNKQLNEIKETFGGIKVDVK
jgi:hypothetical protein